MKKLLALVLAMVMVLSLCVVSSNAAYTDAADIDYKEAVDVMSAAGVFNGMDGSFNPDGILTREQAAKIVTYMLLGKKSADTLVTIAAPFADVAADRWSAGSIAYCYNEGILAGVGNGKFAPEAQLTGLAFAKMMLCALGYDAEQEGLTGENWSINVAKLALSTGLTKKLDDVSLSAPMTREQAAQMAFNTEKADVVTYGNTGYVISTKDVTIKTHTTATKVTNDTRCNDLANFDANLQFAEQYCGKLKYTAGAAEDFGRPSHKWTYDSKSVGTYSDAPVAVFTAKTKAADVVTALAGYNIKVYEAGGDTATYKVNNTTNVYQTANDVYYVVASDVDCGAVTNVNALKQSAYEISGNKTVAGFIAGLTANGKTVEVYADDDTDTIDKFVQINYKVGKVSNIVTDKAGTKYTVASGVSGTISADANVDDTIVLGGELAKGDVVTYVHCNNGMLYVYPTTCVTGTQTSYTDDGVRKITVSGTQYTVANYATRTDFTNGSADANYYLDQFGYVVKTTAVANNNYAYVLDATASVSTSAAGTVNATAKVKVLLSDGTVGTYDLATYKVKASETDNAGDKYYHVYGTYSDTAYVAADDTIVKNTNIVFGNSTVSSSNAANAELNAYLVMEDVYTYTLKDGTITLTPVDKLVAGTFENNATYWTNSDASAGNYVAKNDTAYTSDVNAAYTVLADAKTTFVVYNSDKGTAATYVGTSALPKDIYVVGTNEFIGTFVFDTPANATGNYGTASVAFVVTGRAIANDTTTNYAFVDVSTEAVNGSGDDLTYSYTAYDAKGEKITVTSDNTLGASDGVYVYTADNEIVTGNETGGKFATAAAEYTFEVSGTQVNINNSGWYNITDDTIVVCIDTTLGEVDGNKGFAVLAADSAGNPTTDVAIFYVTKD